MTAMCDVAFLLLSFFILATKFKPPEALSVVTPSSVSTKTAPEKDVVMVIIDKDGKVYLSVSDANMAEKKAMIDAIKGLGARAEKFTYRSPTGARPTHHLICVSKHRQGMDALEGGNDRGARRARRRRGTTAQW